MSSLFPSSAVPNKKNDDNNNNDPLNQFWSYLCCHHHDYDYTSLIFEDKNYNNDTSYNNIYNMGNNYSSNDNKRKSKPKTPLQKLGDKFPFGDNDLRRLMKCHDSLLRQSTSSSSSFLIQLALACQDSTTTTDSTSSSSLFFRRLSLVEKRILPPQFGSTLQRIGFAHALAPPPPSSSTTTTTLSDDKIKYTMLESFVDGCANCERRGGRAALHVLYRCCESLEADDDDNKKGGGGGGGGGVDAKRLVEWGYRLSLAGGYLSSEDDEEEEEGWYSPRIREDLETLAQNLMSFRKTMEMNQGGGGYYGGGGGPSSMGYYNDFQSSSPPQPPPPPSSGSSTLPPPNLISYDTFLSWCEKTLPLFPMSLPTVMHHVLFPRTPFSPGRTPLTLSHRMGLDSVYFGRGRNDVMAFALSCSSTALGGPWHRLYASTEDGLSFNRLLLAIHGYSGPTLLVVTSLSGGTFGAYSSSPWKEDKDFYGTADTFLFQLHPTFGIYRSRNRNNNYQYCNPEARSKGYDRLAHGIGFGGSTTQPRLFLSETFEGCTAGKSDLTFEPGPLLPTNDPDNDGPAGKKNSVFEIDALEVWGVGGDEVVREALGERMKHRDIQAANIKKARTVDKAQFLDDLQSGLIENKQFKHREQLREDIEVLKS